MAERTTVRLPEDLLNRAKRKAAAEASASTDIRGWRVSDAWFAALAIE
jgi:hypothetical protein